MTLSETVKRHVGRWFDAHYLPPTDIPAPLPEPIAAPLVHDTGCDEDGTGAWLPAGLVEVHDEVNIAGRWYAVTGTDTVKPDVDEPGLAVLHFDGWFDGGGYTRRVYVRDEAARIGAEIRGAK